MCKYCVCTRTVHCLVSGSKKENLEQQFKRCGKKLFFEFLLSAQLQKPVSIKKQYLS